MDTHPTRGSSARASSIIDPRAHTALSPDGSRPPVTLTPLRYAMLLHLACLPRGEVAEYADVARAMWPGQVPDPYDGSFDDQIRFHLAQLRQVLVYLNWPTGVIETVHGTGLRLVLTKT